MKQLGRYEIIEPLGRGAMGVVYRARDPLIERTVAIKTIGYAGLTPKEVQDFEQRFFLEAKSAGRLNHPNIVTIHDVGHSDALAYIAMEFLAGESLRSVLDSGVVLPIRRIARIAYGVARGLAFAHDNGVIHRDIKPANIMVLDSDLVKITDFGIALLPSASLTMDGTAVGSPKYMAPEQVLGQKADQRSDIFSLGVVLYEMLTGASPFAGADLNATLYQVLNGAPALPSGLNPDIPPGFDRIVARALAKDPDKRYQSAAEMAADIRNYKRLPGLLRNASAAASETVAVPDAGVRKPEAGALPGAGWPRRQRWLAAGLFAVLALGGYLWFARPPAPPPASPASAANAPPRRVATPAPVEPIVPSAKPAVAPLAQSSPPGVAVPAVKKTRPQKLQLAQKETDSKPRPPLRQAPPVGFAETKPRTADWKAPLRADLAACDSQNFLARALCKERARTKYCPGHWGTIEECPPRPDRPDG